MTESNLYLNKEKKYVKEELQAAIQAFLGSDENVTQRSAHMDELVRITASLPLSMMARWEREIREASYLANKILADREKARKDSLFSFFVGKRKERPRFFSWFDLVSWNGYVRERTLRALNGAAPNGFFFTLAARRLNDWAYQVREAAREAVPEIAKTTNPKHVADALCAMLVTWFLWERIEEKDRQIVLGMLGMDGVFNEIKARIISSPTGPMVQTFSQMLRTPILDTYLEEVAAKAIQPAVRAAAYRVLLSGVAKWIEGARWKWTDVRYCEGRKEKIHGSRSFVPSASFLDLLNLAASDRSPLVRSVASEVLVRKMNSQEIPVLAFARRFAEDVSPSVSNRGKFVLKELGKYPSIS